MRLFNNVRALAAWLLIGTLLMACGNDKAGQAPTGFENIAPAEVKALLDKKADVVLLDVRTPEEFDGPLGHIDNAILIPVQELEKRVDELKPYKDKQIIVYCRSGNRSRFGTKILLNHGYKAVNMTGGMKGWRRMQQQTK
ncbi:MAG: rhodanese-like domain-containing protein [Calditrichaeota bacterium]|nr:MAG: rhodanese-like domain-containing protein [Calditrichota bacterium]